MAIPAVGTQIYFGTGVQTVDYQTAATVDRFFEVVSETLEVPEQDRVESQGLRGGTRNVLFGSKEVITGDKPSGNVTMEVPTKGFGRWFRDIFGGTSTIVQEGATTAWRQTHTLGDIQSRYFTAQKQLRKPDGTNVATFTYTGCMISTATFSVDVGGLLMLEVGLTARREQRDIAAAAASYNVVKPFHWAQGSLYLGGSLLADVVDPSITLDNNLDTDRPRLGAGLYRSQPAPIARPAVEGSFTVDFSDPVAIYDAWKANTALELKLEFIGDVIAGAFSERLTITIPQVRLRGSTPKVGGPEIVPQPVPFVARADDANTPGINLVYVSTDTAI